MTDLRNRIAAAIEDERNKWAGGDAASETLADAVIAALGLEKEFRIGGIAYNGGDGFRVPPHHRYVTEWENDE